MERYVVEEQANGQFRWRDRHTDRLLPIIAVRTRAEAQRRCDRLNRDFVDADWE